jgi:hypothetical protein
MMMTSGYFGGKVFDDIVNLCPKCGNKINSKEVIKACSQRWGVIWKIGGAINSLIYSLVECIQLTVSFRYCISQRKQLTVAVYDLFTSLTEL